MVFHREGHHLRLFLDLFLLLPCALLAFACIGWVLLCGLGAWGIALESEPWICFAELLGESLGVTVVEIQNRCATHKRTSEAVTHANEAFVMRFVYLPPKLILVLSLAAGAPGLQCGIDQVMRKDSLSSKGSGEVLWWDLVEGHPSEILERLEVRPILVESINRVPGE